MVFIRNILFYIGCLYFFTVSANAITIDHATAEVAEYKCGVKHKHNSELHSSRVKFLHENLKCPMHIKLELSSSFG